MAKKKEEEKDTKDKGLFEAGTVKHVEKKEVFWWKLITIILGVLFITSLIFNGNLLALLVVSCLVFIIYMVMGTRKPNIIRDSYKIADLIAKKYQINSGKFLDSTDVMTLPFTQNIVLVHFIADGMNFAWDIDEKEIIGISVGTMDEMVQLYIKNRLTQKFLEDSSKRAEVRKVLSDAGLKVSED